MLGMFFMSLMPIYRRHGMALACCVSISVCMVANGQTAPTTDAAQKDFLTRVFTKCGNSGNLYYFGPVPLPVLMCSPRAKSCQALTEYADAQFKSLPAKAELSAADRKNGIEWQGTVRMTYSTSRVRFLVDGIWQPWGKYLDSTGEMIVGDLLKESGRPWSWVIGKDFQLAPEWMRVIAPGSNLTIQQLDKLRPSCSDISNARSVSAAPVQKITQFNGTADEFAAALPGFLQQAAVAKGLDPHNYEKEVTFIVGVVQTCAKITPQMVSGATDTVGRVHLENLGTQYQVCRPQQSASSQVKPNANPNDPMIWLQMNSRDLAKGQLPITGRFMGGPPGNNGGAGPLYDVVVTGTVH